VPGALQLQRVAGSLRSLRMLIARSLHTVQKLVGVSEFRVGSTFDVMARTQRVTGTVRPHRQGEWLVRLSAGRDPITGRRRQPSKVVVGSRDDARRVLAHMQHELLEGQFNAATLTVSELFSLWIDSPTKSGKPRSRTTRYNDQGRFDRYVNPVLGKRQANEVRPKDFSLLYDALLTRAQPGRQKCLSARSVHHVHSMLRAMFEWGFRREYVADNPVRQADAPSVHLLPPTAPERDVVASHLNTLRHDNDDLALAVWLASTLGLRRSEILGLRWADINLEALVIHIRHGVTKVPGSDAELTDTKTGLHGQVELPLHTSSVSLLASHRAAVETQLASIGATLDPGCFVLSADPEHREPLHPDSLSRALKSHCQRHPELERITLQELRSYAATEVASHGVDETTASALLRNRPETTRRHYQAVRQRELRRHAIGLAERLTSTMATTSAAHVVSPRMAP